MKFAFTKEIKIAVLTIVSGTMLYTGFNFLKGSDTFSRINYYSVYYNNVDGLVAGNPVYVNGFSVGQVKDLELTSDKRVKVLLQVASDVVLSDSTVAKLMNGSLLGGKSIVLVLKKGNKFLADGDSIASFSEPRMTDVLLSKAEPIMQNFDKTLTSANKILDEENQKKIAQLLVNLEAITKNTNELVMANKASIAATTSNLSTLTKSLIETEKQFKPILSNLNSFSEP